jgi:hypothetical protein
MGRKKRTFVKPKKIRSSKAKSLPHPSTMSAEQIAAELDGMFAGPYSQSAQRRIALLTGFDSNLTFGDQCGEDTFENVIGLAMQVSLLIVGQPTDLQHSYASYMLFRICTVGASITELYRRHEREPMTTLDYSSIAVLCRTIFDASIMYRYLTEEVSDEEWILRRAVLGVHDYASRVRLFKAIDPAEAENQRSTLDAEKAKLSELPLFKARSSEEQSKLLSGQIMYVNGMRSLLKSMNVGKVYYDGLYNYLSSHVHLTPLSYFRVRQGSIQDRAFSWGFMGLCLREASRMAIRVVLREIELSKLTDKLDPAVMQDMTKFAEAPMGSH